MNELTFEQIGNMAGVSKQRAWEMLPNGFVRTPENVATLFSNMARKQMLQAAELQGIAMKYQEAARQARQLVSKQEQTA
jgi:hypothetical protein